MALHERDLELMDLPSDWVNNIMHCVETPRLSIVWNGKQLNWFKPSRAIRQGDSISPYIFVLCIERLGHVICSAVELGSWKPIKLSRNGPHLSHLFFVDDLILFAEALVDQIKVVMDCLDQFCEISGQKVSFQKSNICFSRAVDKNEVVRISRIAGIPPTNNLGRYLGTPSLHGRIRVDIYQ